MIQEMVHSRRLEVASMSHGGASCFSPNRKMAKSYSERFCVPRFDYRVCSASSLKIGVVECSRLSGKLFGPSIPRKLKESSRLALLCLGVDSLGDNDDDTHDTYIDIDAPVSRDPMIKEVIDLSKSLEAEVIRAWSDVEQNKSAIQDIFRERPGVKDSVLMAIMEIDLAKARLLKAEDGEAIRSAETELNDWLAKLKTSQEQFRALGARHDMLVKKGNILMEAAKRAESYAEEVREEVEELEIWADHNVGFGRYAGEERKHDVRSDSLTDEQSGAKLRIPFHIDGYDEHTQYIEIDAPGPSAPISDKVSFLSLSLDLEADRAWSHVKQNLSAIQDINSEELGLEEAVQMATMEVVLAEERLQESLNGEEGEVITSTESEVKGLLEKLKNAQDELKSLEARKAVLLKEGIMLKDAATRAQSYAQEVKDNMNEVKGINVSQVSAKKATEVSDAREAPSGSLTDENSGAELSVSSHASKGSLDVGNGDSELGGAFRSIVSRSTQGCNSDHLEQITEEAESNEDAGEVYGEMSVSANELDKCLTVLDELREFLMDHSQIADSSQGEIYVVCQGIRLLKEKFDNRVPLSQTSCKLPSSVSYMLLEKPLELSCETPEASGNNQSPKASVSEWNDEPKELLEDGSNICDKEIEH